MLGAGVILAAVRRRDRSGEGSFVDLSQREVTTSIVPEMLMDYAMNGRTRGPQGNRHEVHAPQGVYPCGGRGRLDRDHRALGRRVARPRGAESAARSSPRTRASRRCWGGAATTTRRTC